MQFATQINKNNLRKRKLSRVYKIILKFKRNLKKTLHQTVKVKFQIFKNCKKISLVREIQALNLTSLNP